MATKVGINGFGRIGRQVLKAIIQQYPDTLEVVAINTRRDPEADAHLFKYDTTYGRYPGTVEAADNSILVDGKEVKDLSEPEPGRIPWGDYGAEIVVEATGQFTNASKALGHMEGGAKKVIISAPATNPDCTIIVGVNEDQYDPQRHRVISSGSCTTNCIVPVAKVLHDSFTIRRGLMSTVHAYTSDQRLLDGTHRDLRRARSAAANIVPTTTGAAKSVGEIIPDLNGRINGTALRVPVLTVSLVDFVADLGRDVTVEEINAAFKEASENSLKGILAYTEEPLVSSDFTADPHSGIFDALSTIVICGSLVKVLTWYDNEWGFSCRMADLVSFLGRKGL